MKIIIWITVLLTLVNLGLSRPQQPAVIHNPKKSGSNPTDVHHEDDSNDDDDDDNLNDVTKPTLPPWAQPTAAVFIGTPPPKVTTIVTEPIPAVIVVESTTGMKNTDVTSREPIAKPSKEPDIVRDSDVITPKSSKPFVPTQTPAIVRDFDGVTPSFPVNTAEVFKPDNEGVSKSTSGGSNGPTTNKPIIVTKTDGTQKSYRTNADTVTTKSGITDKVSNKDPAIVQDSDGLTPKNNGSTVVYSDSQTASTKSGTGKGTNKDPAIVQDSDGLTPKSNIPTAEVVYTDGQTASTKSGTGQISSKDPAIVKDSDGLTPKSNVPTAEVVYSDGQTASTKSGTGKKESTAIVSSSGVTTSKIEDKTLETLPTKAPLSTPEKVSVTKSDPNSFSISTSKMNQFSTTKGQKEFKTTSSRSPNKVSSTVKNVPVTSSNITPTKSTGTKSITPSTVFRKTDKPATKKDTVTTVRSTNVVSKTTKVTEPGSKNTQSGSLNTKSKSTVTKPPTSTRLTPTNLPKWCVYENGQVVCKKRCGTKKIGGPHEHNQHTVIVIVWSSEDHKHHKCHRGKKNKKEEKERKEWIPPPAEQRSKKKCGTGFVDKFVCFVKKVTDFLKITDPDD